MSFRYQFFRPLAYLFVKGNSLNFYRWYAPAGCVLLASLSYGLLPVPLALVGDKSIAGYLLPFFSSLPGFFIAALAAVVAFNNEDLDGEVSGVSAKITVNDETEWLPISLRVFLCYLFAYLTIVSFLGFFFCMLGIILAPNVVLIVAKASPEFSASIIEGLRFVFLGGMAFASGTLIFCTVQGLYFLAERVHQKLS